MIAQLFAALASAIMGAASPAMVVDQLREFRAVPLEQPGHVLGEATEVSSFPPVLIRKTAGPVVMTEAFIVVDVASGMSLARRGASAQHSVASLTKILTAITALHHVQPDEEVVISEYAASQRHRGANMDLRADQVFLAEDLIAAMLIASANDAAVAIAEHIAGSEESFAKLMNEQAQFLGLTSTRVVNATGFDAQGHYSTPHDIAMLLSHAWTDPTLGVYLRAVQYSAQERRTGAVRRITTTNRLLGERVDILAGKTGFTNEAGQSVAVVAENEHGNPVVAVLLGSEDRFADMDNLLNWTFWAYQWK